MTDFEQFCDYFKQYQEKFGLQGWKVYFKYEPCEDRFASISTNWESLIATVFLNSEIPAKDKPFLNIHQCAKHEALHLLIGTMEHLARERYIREDEIYEACEELVHKLEGLIPNV